MTVSTADDRKPATRRKGRAHLTAREVPPALQWTEGMLLAPQHFQSMALRQEALLHYHTSAVSPFHWGLMGLEIDRTMLMDGLFRVVELEAVMPDGLLVSWCAGPGTDLKIDLNARVAELAERPMRIHLAVSARGDRLAHAERYSIEDGPALRDDNTGEEMPADVLRPKLHLLAGDDPSPKYVHFPIAEVSYRNDVFSLSTTYQPPWLRVAEGSPTYELCLGIATRLREKAMFVSNQVSALSSAARTTQLLETKALVHALVGELPMFEALLRTGATHPFQLYLGLCSVLGHVAGLGRALVPPALDPYDHNDLYASFTQAQGSIAKALDEGIHEAYTAYPLIYQEGEYRIVFYGDWSTRALILGVRAPQTANEADMAAWVKSAVIAGNSKIVMLRDLRVLGIPRKPIGTDSDLVPSRGVSLYSIAFDPELVAAGEELVIVNPGRPVRPQEIVLYVRNRV